MSIEKITTGCPYDCGASCPLVVYVEDGRVVRVGPEEGADTPDAPRLRPCAKGLAHVQRIYHPDRLLYPLKRVGDRGEGAFQRISWDEALDTVASELRRVRDVHGPESVLNLRGAANTDGLLHRTSTLPTRFFNAYGGATHGRASVSFEGAVFAGRTTFGFPPPPSDNDNVLYSKLVILWGMNPSESIFGTNSNWHLARAKEGGTKLILVDPRFTDSAAALADQWIPIRPATDTAMLVAMACVLIDERLCDDDFLRRYTHGFDAFRDYCIGTDDGIHKSPAWAAPICGVRAETIAGLAREYAKSRPADLRGGWAPGRTGYGEQFHRACAALSAMTGNIGKPGGGPGCWVAQDFHRTLGASPVPPLRSPTNASVVAWRWADAVLEGKAGGYPNDIKLIYSIGGNRLNQCGDIAKGIRALKKAEFVVVHDQFMTPMARFADVLLPVTTHFEREDVQAPHNQGHYLIYNRRVIEPLGEARSDLEILTELARHLEMLGFDGRDEQDWLRELAQGVPSGLEGVRAEAVYRFPTLLPRSPLDQFIADPEGHPLPTPSGKIEIRSQVIARSQDPRIPDVPKYLGGSSPASAAERSPLLMVTVHTRKAVHSTFRNVPWLQELEPDSLWLNPVDAAARGIVDGQRIRAFNGTGTMVVRARVTERITQGVVAVNQGAWYQPDGRGWDLGGAVNVVCPDAISPGEAAVTNGIAVEVAGLDG